MSKTYTNEFLISELHSFVREEGFVPNQNMMNPKYGYPSYATYISHFGSWNNALIKAGLKLNKSKIYTNEFLISELHRFVRENGRVPMWADMNPKYGYPAAGSYQKHFKTWNRALESAGLKINKKHHVGTLDGTEICFHCNKKANEILGFRQWIYDENDNERYCNRCGTSNGIHDYIKKELNPKSSIGKATISQRVVFNVLKLEEKNDCNCSVSFGHPYDLYDKDRYNYINVKDSKLHEYSYKNPFWYFDFTQKEIPDTYIMLGYDNERKHILRVWITDPLDDIVFDEKNGEPKKSFSITNNIYLGLKRAEPLEVDAKPYDDMLHQMSQKRKDTNGKNCVLSNDNLKGDCKCI